MKKLATIFSAMALVLFVGATTVSASAGPAWYEYINLGDTYYAQSTYSSANNEVILGSDLTADEVTAIDDVLFSDSDGIDYSIIVAGDTYKCTGTTCTVEGEIPCDESTLNTIADIQVGPGTVVTVEMDVVNAITSSDVQNLMNLNTVFGFTDADMFTFFEDEQDVSASSEIDGQDYSTELSHSPFDSSTTCGQTSTSDDEQSIATTGEVK